MGEASSLSLSVTGEGARGVTVLKEETVLIVVGVVCPSSLLQQVVDELPITQSTQLGLELRRFRGLAIILARPDKSLGAMVGIWH